MQKTFLLKLLVLLFLLFLQNGLKAQVDEIIEEEAIEQKTIDLTEFVSLLSVPDKQIIISDFEIVSSIRDTALMTDKVFFRLYELQSLNNVVERLYIYDCDFKLDGDAEFVFANWSLLKIKVIGCEFLNPVRFDGLEIKSKHSIIIENCLFHNKFEFTNSELSSSGLIIRNTVFNYTASIDNSMEQLVFENCRFLADSSLFLKLDNENTTYQLLFGNQSFGEVEFNNNTFDNQGFENVFSINFENVSFSELKMESNKLHSLNLTGAKVEKSLLIDSLFVSDYIGVSNFDFPRRNTNIPWYNLSGEKFSIFYSDETESIIPYQAKTDEEIAQNLYYNDLISAYNKFNELFHNRGDKKSANASYIEIKDIETRKQAYDQKVSPTFNNLINYKLNVFLKYFSDYATNPGKSIIQSLWFLLFFGILYMLTFSEWDGMNYWFYVGQYKRFSEYIKTGKKLEDIYELEDCPHKDELSELKQKYLSAGKELPRILRLFGHPLHFLGQLRYSLIPKLIVLFDFQPKAWETLGRSAKIWSLFSITIIALTYFLYVFILKFINSMLLSMNSFIVIGFGSLPEKGIAMYLSIIEGIIGWFLLTIFTVTLLSQVLQNT